MKTSLLTFACLLLAACNPSNVSAQAFVNLDFETVVLASDPMPPAFGSVISVPGWTFSEHNPPQFEPNLSSQPQQFLITDNFGLPPSYIGAPFEGHYSVGFVEGYYAPDNTPIGPSVSQTGLIPAGTKSVRFAGGGGYLGGNESLWIVSINGTPVPITRFADGTIFGTYPNYTGILSADISAFAGTTATLKFALDPTHNIPIGPLETSGVLDAIRFSPLEYTEVPEPTSIILALLSLALFALKSPRTTSSRL